MVFAHVRNKFWLLILFSVALFCGNSPAQGRNPCPVLLLNVSETYAPKEDTGIEFELRMNSQTLALLTTEDGTVGPPLGDHTPPAWLLERASQSGYADARKLPWDHLGENEKRELIKYSGMRTYIEVEPQGLPKTPLRLVHGFVVRDSAVVQFEESTELFGRVYPARTNGVIPIGKFLKTPTFLTQADKKNVTGIELHLQWGGARHGEASMKTSEVFKNGLKLLKALNVDLVSVQYHNPNAVREAELKKDPRFYAIRTAEYTRRVNLAHEWIYLVNSRGSLGPTVDEPGFVTTTPFQKNAAGWVAQGAHNFLKPAELAKLKDRIPTMVSFRLPGVYVSPYPLWGLENRHMATLRAPEWLRDYVMDGVQAALETNDFGIAESKLREWDSEYSGQKTAVEVARSLVPTPERSRILTWIELKKRALSQMDMTSPEARHLERALQVAQLGLEDSNLFVLLYDWKKDPLYFGNPLVAQEVTQLQKAAIKLIADGENPRLVARQFLIQSGLYERMLRSIAPSMPSGQP